MAKLTSKARKALPKGDFALPGGRYPVEDASHARNALARVSQHGDAEEKKEVRAKVHEKFPEIGRGESMKKEEKKEPHRAEGKKESKGAERKGRSEGMKKHMGAQEGHKAIGEQKGYCK
jgi:hypothetical protein